MRYNVRHHQPLLSYGATAAAFSASPTFYAPLTNSLIPTTATGSGTPTFFTGATVATFTDWEGMVRRSRASEARFTGSRRVENLIAGSSENLNHASWSKSSGGSGSAAPTITANFATDPLGGSTASRGQFNMGSDAVNGYSDIYNTYAVTGVRAFRTSVWLKANTGTPTVLLGTASSGGTPPANYKAVVVDSTWRRYTTTVVTTVTATSQVRLELGLEGTTYTAGVACSASADVLMWGAQLEEMTGQSNTNPGEYVSVGVLAAPYHGCAIDGVKCFATKNGNTVASGIITEAVGAAITSASGGSTLSTDAVGPLGLIIDESISNVALNGEDINAWTVSAATITNNALAGPTGEVLADALVENTANSPHFVHQVVSKATSAITYTFSVFAKKGARDEFNMTASASGGNAGVYCNVNNGTVRNGAASGDFAYTGSGVLAFPNGWYRFWLTFTSNAINQVDLIFYGYDGTSVSYTGTSAICGYFWGAQLQVNNYMSDFLPAAHTYAGLTYPFASNAVGTVGTVYAETKTRWTTASAAAPLVAFGVATAYPLYSNSEASTVIRANDGTNNVAKTGLSDSSTAVRKRAASWTGSTLAITGDGLAAASGTFDGNMGSTAIGVGAPTTGTAVVWRGTIRNVKLYTVAATAAELATLTA